MNSGATMRYSNFRKDESSGEAFFIGGIMLTQDKLKTILEYNPETGIFKWSVKYNKKHKSMYAGTVGNRGYIRICINKKLYQAHRLAWLYVYGEWPTLQIDHINMIKTDNRIINLRDVSNQENQHNHVIARKDSKSGLLGVHFVEKTSKWAAQININGKRKKLGYFLTKEDAHNAYMFAKRLHHKGFITKQ